MSAAVGLARLPRPLVRSLEEAAENLFGAANDLDGLLFAAPPAVAALEVREADARRIRHDVRVHVAAARRTGPDRLRLIGLADSAGSVVERLRDVAWVWTDRPLPRTADAVGAVRDCARACANGLGVHEDTDLLTRSVDRCEACEDDARARVRSARAALVIDGADERVALRADELLDRIEVALRSCIDLRQTLLRHALA